MIKSEYIAVFVVAVFFFGLGWQTTFWTGQFINADGIDGNIAECLKDQNHE